MFIGSKDIRQRPMKVKIEHRAWIAGIIRAPEQNKFMRPLASKSWHTIVLPLRSDFFDKILLEDVGIDSVDSHMLSERSKIRKVGGVRSSLDFLVFEPVKRPDDRADYCLDCSFLPYCKHQVLIVEWIGARPMGEQWWGLGPMSFPSELGDLAMPINFLA